MCPGSFTRVTWIHALSCGHCSVSKVLALCVSISKKLSSTNSHAIDTTLLEGSLAFNRGREDF